MLFSWLKGRRRRRWLAQPFPAERDGYIQRNLARYGKLTERQRNKLRRDVQVFVAEKHWGGCGGLQISDEMKVTIAAQACWMLLGIDEGYCFDGVRTILVYPSAYSHSPQRLARSSGIVHENLPVTGEAWERGPIVLAWDVVRAEGRNPHSPSSLVIHEFAHHLDGLDGEMAGTPPLSHGDAWQWEKIVGQEYEQLFLDVQQGAATLLDPYGATNRAEFFAVASECFFCRPVEMRTQHAELYRLLGRFYELDPAGWYGDAERSQL